MSDPLELSTIARLTMAVDLLAVYEQGLRPQHFEDPINQAVFGYSVEFWKTSQMKAAPTLLVLETEFGKGYVDKLPVVHLVEEPAWYLAQTLMNRYARNTVQQIMIDIATNVDVDPQASLSAMASRAMEAAAAVSPRNTRSDMSEVTMRRDRYMDRFNSDVAGMTLGIPELDDLTGGIQPGELCALAGFTKTGKSWALFNAAVAARRQGFTPLIMSLEMGIKTTEDRIDALWSGVSYQRLEASKLRLEEMNRLVAGQDELREAGPIYIEQPQRGERTVSYMASRARQLGADYLIIDQLSWIDSAKEYKGDSSQRLKTADLIFELSDEIKRSSVGQIPCLLAVQLNRQAAIAGGRGGGARGQMQNFAHSSMIEQTVDLALGIYQTDEQRVMSLMGIDIMGARRAGKAELLLDWELIDRTEISFHDRLDGVGLATG